MLVNLKVAIRLPKTPAQAAAKSLKRARQKARKRAALATATSGAVT